MTAYLRGMAEELSSVGTRLRRVHFALGRSVATSPSLTKIAPKGWKLGKLIEQAKAARTFSDADAHLAETLQDLRNRIHVGKFAASGPERFKPPFANTHEATLAVRHLDLLLTRILARAPISVLV